LIPIHFKHCPTTRNSLRIRDNYTLTSVHPSLPHFYYLLRR